MVWAAVASELRRMGKLRMALFLLVSLSSYARPSELIRLQVYCLVRPSPGIASSWTLLMSPEEKPDRTKTGEFDTSIALDTPYMIPWSHTLFGYLKQAHPSNPLWDFDYNQYCRDFQIAVTALGLDLTPYLTRHSGPSIDRSRGYRSQLEVQKRGQWKSQTSVMRYEKAARLAATALPIVRGKAWGDHVGVMPKSRLRKKQVSRKYIMDLFAGHGGVSEACEKLGYFTKQWDIKHGPMHDLTDRSVVKRLIRDIRKGRVLGVMMAPVCTSFSRARDRTKVIRSLRFPWGIPKRFLSEKEALSVKLGNACFRSCIQLIHVLNLYSIPWILENPWMSRCWQLPPIRQLLQKNSAFLCRGDFCQWGTKWRKPTGFLFNHVDDSYRLHRPCQGHPPGYCSRTGQRHWLLTGSGPGNKPWTKIAEPYPKKLCNDLAHVLTSKYHATLHF